MEGSTGGGGCGGTQSIAFEIHKAKNFTAADTLQYPKQPSPLCPPLPALFGLPSFHLGNACIRIQQHACQCNSYPAPSQKNHSGILPNETQLQLLSLSPATFIKYATIELNLSSNLGNSNTCSAGLGLAQQLHARLVATYTAEEKCRLLAQRCIWIPPICVHVNRC